MKQATKEAARNLNTIPFTGFQVLYMLHQSQVFARELSYFWNWFYEKPASHSPNSSVIHQPANYYLHHGLGQQLCSEKL